MSCLDYTSIFAGLPCRPLKKNESRGRFSGSGMGKIILGKDFLRSFQTLKIRLLSPGTSGQARPYCFKGTAREREAARRAAALWPAPRLASWRGGRAGNSVMELLLRSPPRMWVSENMCAGSGVLMPSVRNAAGDP